MATQLPHPSVEFSVPEILNALEIDGRGDDGEPEQYLVIPGNWGPRWLVPAQSRASATVLGSWRPYAISSQVKWSAIRIAARTGVLRLVGSVSSAGISRTGAMRWFERCRIQSQQGELVILVGNPSPDRKLIVFLLDDEHRIAAVLKVGLTQGGGLSVLREAETLKKLERYNWAPGVLTILPDLHAAAQEYVCGSTPNRRFRPEYMNLLCQMPQTGVSRNLVDVAGDLASRLSPFKDRMDQQAPYLLNRSLACLDLDIAVPTMLVHGDFAPWNIRKNPKAGYVLVDWEWADFAGLPAYDLLHFQFSENRLLGGGAGPYSAIRARSICREYFRRIELDEELSPRLAIAYLLDILGTEFDHRGSQYSAYAAYLLRQQ